MFYGAIAGIAILISALAILAQLIFLPIFLKHTAVIRHDVEERMKLFKLLADLGDMKLAREHQELLRRKKSLNICPPPEPGPPGPPGDPGEDGEQGDDGPTGYPGKSTLELLEERQQQCIICPQGARGPPGAPGNQGIQGSKGDRGITGISGMDGLDGEVGLEGPEGYNGTNGMRGPKGPNGRPATGGVGKPGPKGLPGSIGRTGLQGPQGRRNYVYGLSGPDGKKGVKGMNGISGSFGPRGNRGPVGEPGANALFCPCPMEIEMLNAKQTEIPQHQQQQLQQQQQLTKLKTTVKRRDSEKLDDISTPISQLISSLSSIINLDDMRKYSNENSNLNLKEQLLMSTEEIAQKFAPQSVRRAENVEVRNEKDTNDPKKLPNFAKDINSVSSDENGNDGANHYSDVTLNYLPLIHTINGNEKNNGKSEISKVKNKRITLATITTTTTPTTTTITSSRQLITGYPDETTGPTRPRFIYVTKRPRPL